MSDRLTELGQATRVYLVTFTKPENLEAYRSSNSLSFPVLIDADRKAYQAFGLGRGSFGRVYGWRTMRRYLQIFRTGGLASLERATEDTLQLGGDFVVAADGRLAYGYWGEGPDDRPEVEALIAAVDRFR